MRRAELRAARETRDQMHRALRERTAELVLTSALMGEVLERLAQRYARLLADAPSESDGCAL